MLLRNALATAVVSAVVLSPIVGCESLPGGRREQATVIGGAGGAVAGAMLAEDSLLGALVGGALGAGGGYLIGAEMTKIEQRRSEEAIDAARQAEQQPARPADVRGARTADLNQDGFVTLDEVIAMHEYGLSDREMIRMLEDTGQVFELTPQQEQMLRERGVSQNVIAEMRQMNREQLRQAAEREPPRDVIGREPEHRQ